MPWVSISGNLPPGLKVRDLAIHPTSPGTLFLATEGTVYESTDGGTIWNPWSSGLPAWTAVRGLSIKNDTGTVNLMAGTWGRSWFVRDTASSWP